MAEIATATQRVALYARVSTDEQKEGQTIDSQIAEIERFARDRSWLIAGVYRDEGWSGALMARPEMDRLRDDARKGLFDAVLINDVDRLARDVAHLGIIKRDLERQGVRVIFRKLPSDASPTNNLMVNILGSFAEFERELIADRTRRGRRHKVEVRQRYLGSNTSYGYRYTRKEQTDDKQGLLRIEPHEAAVIRQMFHWVDVEGLSARRVMLRLNERNTTPQKGRIHWAKSSVLRVLHNEMYCGVWHYNKHERNGHRERSESRWNADFHTRLRQRSEWIPLQLPESLHIIPREQWERVQTRIASNIAFSPRNERHRYLLKGLVRCGSCKARYAGDSCHGKYYYRCLRRCKQQPSVTEAKLDEAVKNAVKNVLLRPELILEPIRQIEKDAREGNRRNAHETTAIDREFARLEQEERRLLDAYQAGVISPVQLGGQLEGIKAKREIASIRKSELADRPIPLNQTAEESVLEYCEEAARNLQSFGFDEWQQLLRTVVDEILFDAPQLSIQGKIGIKDQRTDTDASSVKAKQSLKWAGNANID